MLSSVFAYIRIWWVNFAGVFNNIATWLLTHGIPWSYLAPLFQSLRDICYTIANYFYNAYSAAFTIETQLADAWSKAKQVFAYAYDVLAVKVNDALNAAGNAWDKAVTAYNKARDAWNYATGWLTDLAYDAYNKAVWAYNQIAAAVTAKAQEIYAWVKSIPAEIKNYVAGIVAAIGAVTTDIVQTLIKLALAAIAGPINLINLWFDAIQGFFNDPWGWLVDKFTNWFLGPEE